MKQYLKGYASVFFILLFAIPSYAQSDCPITGDNKSIRVQTADLLKNRDIIPKAYAYMDFDTLLNMKVSDTTGFDSGVYINGYILDIREGGAESCNCHSKVNKDTHIYVVKDSSVSEASQAVIVEVTPRFRGVGTTAELKEMYLHKNVVIRGYLFRDEEHKQNSAADNGKGLLWRGTVWEVHPVTEIVLR